MRRYVAFSFVGDVAYDPFMVFSGLGARRVLVVEDDADLRGTIAQSLADEGYAVDVACNGHDALQALARSAAHLVLLDLMMPGMSGWEFRERQRNHPAFAAIPVVVMTATPTLEAAAIDADDLLAKPVMLDELLAAVHRHIRAPFPEFDLAPKTDPCAMFPFADER